MEEVTTVAFTGPVNILPERVELVQKVVGDLEGVDEFVTGGARGVDTIVALHAARTFPKAKHTIVYPDAPWNEDLVKDMPGNVDFATAPEGGYMARNDELVRRADLLVAFPISYAEQRRSGTWATIRRARDAGVPVNIFPLGDDS